MRPIPRAALLALAALLATNCLAFGADPDESAQALIARSPRHSGESFINPERTTTGFEQGSFGEFFKRSWRAPDPRPAGPIPVAALPDGVFDTRIANGVRFTWVGHASVLVELDGARVLTDPIWSERCSPVSFAGPQRFHAPGIPWDKLPEIDAVIISHDHYDHLDMETVKELDKRGVPFFVPLGVGTHLRRWGVKQVTELDWWEHADITSPTGATLQLGPTPARHFSGRSLTDRNSTLWASWAIIGPTRRVWFGGDTGIHETGFKEIGDKLGPFDLTIIPIGAYDPQWHDVHMNPEEAITAHTLVRGGVMFPIHWGTFDLALHTWRDPIDRLLAAAQAQQVTLALPMPGLPVRVGVDTANEPWWNLKTTKNTLNKKDATKTSKD
jgi:L-ascorbate metabolism protein UlaG (beta-lactamase superfamily)